MEFTYTLRGIAMTGRLLALALLFSVACSTEMPLEAQRDLHARYPGTTELSWFEEHATFADGRGFAGTWSITQITQGSDGAFLASGTVVGTAGGGAEVNESFSDVPVRIYTPTVTCVEVRFELGPMPLSGSTMDFEWQSVWKSTTDGQLFRSLCGLIKGSQVERNLATINGIIGA